jgi:hypothetical protein
VFAIEDLLLRYHSKTLQMLALTPCISPAAVAELNEAEVRLRRPLPASVREWYSQENAVHLLRQYSNCDWPVQVAEFGVTRTDADAGGSSRLSDRGLLVFRCENQGVCAWAVRLDGDDPPVIVDDDLQFRHGTVSAPSFSTHLHAWMWDYALVLSRDLLVQAQNRVLSATALESLRHEFDVGPLTYGWPGHRQYRFSRRDERILIWVSEDQADWWLSADSEDSLRRLLTTVWDVDHVGKSLWSHSERGEAALDGI